MSGSFVGAMWINTKWESKAHIKCLIEIIDKSLTFEDRNKWYPLKDKDWVTFVYTVKRIAYFWVQILKDWRVQCSPLLLVCDYFLIHYSPWGNNKFKILAKHIPHLHIADVWFQHKFYGQPLWSFAQSWMQNLLSWKKYFLPAVLLKTAHAICLCE